MDLWFFLGSGSHFNQTHVKYVFNRKFVFLNLFGSVNLVNLLQYIGCYLVLYFGNEYCVDI